MERRQQRINEQIRVTPVRLVSAEGEQLGVVETEEAMRLATEAGLDLVEVAPTEKPPVCRIMDYGKYKYQQKKRQSRSHTHQVRNKEIRLRPKIGQHDLDFKTSKAREFLEQKDKVVVSVVFRGRENAHTDEGFKVVRTLLEKVEDLAKVEQPAAMHGRRIVMILAPK